MKTAPPGIKPQTLLTCPYCGNTNRFVEVMAEEAHLVNGRLDYIRLVAAVTCLDPRLIWFVADGF